MGIADLHFRADARAQDAARQGGNNGSGFGGLKPRRKRGRPLAILAAIAFGAFVGGSADYFGATLETACAVGALAAFGLLVMFMET